MKTWRSKLARGFLDTGSTHIIAFAFDVWLFLGGQFRIAAIITFIDRLRLGLWLYWHTSNSVLIVSPLSCRHSDVDFGLTTPLEAWIHRAIMHMLCRDSCIVCLLLNLCVVDENEDEVIRKGCACALAESQSVSLHHPIIVHLRLILHRRENIRIGMLWRVCLKRPLSMGTGEPRGRICDSGLWSRVFRHPTIIRQRAETRLS